MGRVYPKEENDVITSGAFFSLCVCRSVCECVFFSMCWLLSVRVLCGRRIAVFPLIPNLCNINEEIDAGTWTQCLSVPKSIYVCTVHTFLKFFENALYVCVCVCRYMCLYTLLIQTISFFPLSVFGLYFFFYCRLCKIM